MLFGYLLVPEQAASAEQIAIKDDAIARLVAKLSASYVWRNGIYPRVDLPARASTDEVIARLFEMTSFAEGRAKQYYILETRIVQIPDGLPRTYIAALVRTEYGDKIVLLQYVDVRVGWWSRVYDSDPEP